MNYDRVILELLERIQKLEEKMTFLENRKESEDPKEATHQGKKDIKKVSMKYRGLTELLLKTQETKIRLTYPEIEKALGFALPESSRNYPRSFWANTYTHSYASSWLSIGYKARVDRESRTVTFEKDLF